MKIILGDNQFFGVNHSDLKKGDTTKKLFNSTNAITNFINSASNLGLNGFMINSNKLGYDVVKNYRFSSKQECHYSIPYPHKYASIVNESGMIALLAFLIKKIKITDIFQLFRFALTFNATHLLPILIKMEIPKSLPKGSIVYLQNVVTDLIMGLNGGDKILIKYIKSIEAIGYKPGIITLNPVRFYELFGKKINSTELFLCFNLNYSGFNVFPSVFETEKVIKEIKENCNWQLMAMSILSSGSKDISIGKSLDYIKSQNLDYVVFGSSSLKNIQSNIEKLKDF